MLNEKQIDKLRENTACDHIEVTQIIKFIKVLPPDPSDGVIWGVIVKIRDEESSTKLRITTQYTFDNQVNGLGFTEADKVPDQLRHQLAASVINILNQIQDAMMFTGHYDIRHPFSNVITVERIG